MTDTEAAEDPAEVAEEALDAEAMVKQVVDPYRVPKQQRLRFAGVGFLAPIASNNSEEGRAKNRRVELVAD